MEYLKQHQEATIRHYRMMMIAAFVVGIVSGAITVAYVLSVNSRIIVSSALSLLMTFGIIIIVNNVQEIVRNSNNKEISLTVELLPKIKPAD